MNTYFSENKTYPTLKINLFLFFTLCFCFFAIISQNTVKTETINSLKFCLNVLIPSLFPMIFASEILVSYGFLQNTRNSKVFRILTGINEKGASAFILGIFCGFPIGCKIAADLYGKKLISKKEAEILSAYSNNAGISFVICALGSGTAGSLKFGIILYFSGILSALSTAVICRFMFKKEFQSTPKTKFSLNHQFAEPLSDVITRSISNAATAILKICAFTLFFSLCSVWLCKAASFFNLSPSLITIISVFLEISSGALKIKENFSCGLHGLTYLGKILLFTLIGFGGLSAYFQSCTFLSKYGLDSGKYLRIKLLQCLICTLLGIILIHLFAL